MKVAVEAHFSDPVHDLGWTSPFIPRPTATPAPAPLARPAGAVAAAAAVYSAPGDIHAIIASYGWPLQEALDVAQCESGMNPLARNPSGATGLFQLIGGNDAMFDPATNVAAAYRKYLDGVAKGNPWWHWNQFGSCGHF